MGEIHYSVKGGMQGGFCSQSVLSNQPVLARIPGTNYVTHTPAVQAGGYPVVMALADSTTLSKALVPNSLSNVKEEVEQLKARVDKLYATVEPILNNRALPFVDYIKAGLGNIGKGNAFYATAERMTQGPGSYAKTDVDQLVGRLWNQLSKTKEAKNFDLLSSENEAKAKKLLKGYINTGELGQELAELLTALVNTGFSSFQEYMQLNAKLEEIGPKAELSSRLELALDDLASGKGNGTVEILGKQLDLAGLVEAQIGAKPAKYFLCETAAVVEGKNQTGLVVPYAAKAFGAGGVPEEIRQSCSYLPLTTLNQIIRMFDGAIRKTLLVYGMNSPEIKEMDDNMHTLISKTFPGGILMPTVFPKGHMPISIIYSQKRISFWIRKRDVPGIKDHWKNIRQIQETMAAVWSDAAKRPEIPAPAEEYFGLAKGTINFEELVGTQATFMQFLPREIYEYVATTEAPAHTSKELSILASMRQGIRISIKNRFGIDMESGKFNKITEETKAAAEQLLWKNLDAMWKVHETPVLTKWWEAY